ncbi:MAG: Pup--protein ligase [Austwickia sp.]|nr:Pup--protein ligase [Actinomycetota bacterium]MCB1252543.1 Pup--protein ligase [Austwickia sp.]MCO5308173.1 Pup--protein ligase [Austwickia sp.]
MDRRIMGLETEYGVACTRDGVKALTPDEVARYLFRGIVAASRSSNVFLANGGRLYLDVGNHPEYATAECDTLPDLLAQDRAGTEIMVDLVRQAQERMRGDGVVGDVYLFRNNVDSAGNSYGCHENYLVARTSDLHVLADALVGFLVSRQLICGAGRIVTGKDGVEYCLSQRADVMWEGASSATTRSRPMINTRDEPHADAAQHRRLHVIVGDSNMAESSTLLKVATADLVLRALEAGAAPPPVAPANTATAIRAVARDLAGRASYVTVDGRTITALDAQRAYFAVVAEHLDRHGATRPWDEQVRDLWDEVLTALEAGEPARVARHVDWIAKHALLTRQAQRHGLAWDDARMLQLDMLYHDIDPARGLAMRLEAAGALHRWTTPEAVAHAVQHPPATTRAALRGAFVAAAQERRREYTVDWTHLRLDGTEGRTAICKDPFASTDERVEALLAMIASGHG